ncbi:MAG: ribosomal protein L7/L12 [Bacteroidales bacterium]|nr:ribosomal protein L7/L12 [Bacteroidales bacterium]
MNILDSYPVFENNQVLTSDQLNNLVKYLDQQNRLTRSQLIGIGTICGFHIKYDTTENALTITKGVGITSEGFLLEQGDCATRWYRKYDYTKSNITYPPFEDITNKNHPLDVELFELLSTSTDPTNEFKLSKAFLADKVVLLFLEIFDQDLKTCLAKSCDEIGQTRIFTVRKLLISTKDMDKVLQRLNIDNYDPTFPNKFELPVITIPRVNIKPDEAAAKDKSLLLKKYVDAVEMVKNNLLDAIKLTYTTYNPILKDVYAKDYFGNGKIIDTEVLDWDTYLNGDLYGVQYFYDFIKDLTLAYDEFKNTAFELCNECLIDMERFPLHLMLGLAIPDKDYNINSTPYRNRFIHSPAYSIQKYLTLKARSLHQRIVSMIISFDLEYISKSDNKIKDLFIVPSHEKLSKLSDRSIPFYYYPDNKDIPLIDYWNFDIEKRKLSDYILSYHHKKSPYPLEVKSTLKYDIDKYSFLRIEGLLGKDVESVKSTLEQQKKDFNLSFKIVSLQLNPSANELILDPCLWCDLEVLYFNARLAYLDIFQKLLNDIKEIASYSLQLKFNTIDITVTQQYIDNTIKYLPEKINDFIFQDFFKNYCILLELLQVYKLNILHYQERLIHELINVTSKEDFQKSIIQINSSLSFIQKVLEFGVYKELYLLFNRLENRKKYLKENHLSVFSNFLNANPGMNHEGGAKNDGTLVLVSELDATDKKYKVFADFTLPYLCCCDCNDIPCEEEEINYNQLPYLALPDGVICEINCPVDIQALNNDYILYGADLILSSANQYVKCDPQSKIITYKRNDTFTGIDTFAYTLDRKIVKATEVEQPIIAKKKKGYFAVPADTQVVTLPSANVKVLIHNKYYPSIQAFDDIEIVTQHDQITIDVLKNDIKYDTTQLYLPSPNSLLGGQVSIIDDGTGKKVIKFIPNNAGKDSFKYQLKDDARVETSEATVTVFVTKFDLTVPDIVFLVTSPNQNSIPIVLSRGWSINPLPTLPPPIPTTMGTLILDTQKPGFIFTPGDSFTNSKTLSFNYILLNAKNEAIKGIVHLISGLDEYSIPDTVYMITKPNSNTITIDYAISNNLQIINIENLPANIGTYTPDAAKQAIIFTPGVGFSTQNSIRFNYVLKNMNTHTPSVRGTIHLINRLEEYSIPDIVYRITNVVDNIIPINYAQQYGYTIEGIEISPDSAGSYTIDNVNRRITFKPSSSFNTLNLVTMVYHVKNPNNLFIIKGTIHLINGLEEYPVTDIVYKVTIRGSNSILIDYAKQNSLAINKVDLSDTSGGACTYNEDTITFTPNLNFVSLKTLKLTYYLNNNGPTIKGIIHLINGLEDIIIPDTIHQITSLGKTTIPIEYTSRTGYQVSDELISINEEIGKITPNKDSIIFETGINYSSQNVIRFTYVLIKSGSETLRGNVYLINSLKQSEEYKDYFSEVMAGTVMAFAYDPTNNYDVVLTSLGRDASKVVEVLISITGLKPEEVKVLVTSLPATIKKRITLAEATDIAKLLTSYGATVETPDWLKQHGWLICDGMQYNRLEYSRLFDRIKTLYGAGDARNTFNVPDLRGEFLRGWDINKGIDKGRVLGSRQLDQIQSHSHQGSISTNGDHYHPLPNILKDTGGAYGTPLGGGSGLGITWPGYNRTPTPNSANSGNHTHALTISYPSTLDQGTPRYGNETRPDNVAVLYCIKF